MDAIRELYEKYIKKANKYYLTLAIFALVTFFVGDSTPYQRFLYNKKIKELKSEIKQYKNQIEEDKAKLSSLRMNNESLERYAREQFLMTQPNEDLYIITPN